MRDFRKSSRPNEVYVCCPFCQEKGKSPDTEYKLGVNLKNGLAHCFRCGWKSYGQNTFQKLQMAPDLSGFREEAEEPKEKPNFRLPPEYVPIRKNDRETRQAWTYLNYRGVTEEQIRKKKIGVAISGRYEGRVIFPLWDEQKKLAGFIGRDYTGKGTPKYKNSQKLRRVWYGSHRLPGLTPDRQLVLVEGIFDALAVERAGHTALASLGKDVTEEQESQIDRFHRLILFMDRDTDGVWKWLDLAGRLFRWSRSVRLAIPPAPYKDAGETPLEETQKALAGSFSWDPAIANYFRVTLLAGGK